MTAPPPAAFAGHDPLSTSKAIYDDNTQVAPAERIYSEDAADNYDPADYADQPGASARSDGWPQAV